MDLRHGSNSLNSDSEIVVEVSSNSIIKKSSEKQITFQLYSNDKNSRKIKLLFFLDKSNETFIYLLKNWCEKRHLCSSRHLKNLFKKRQAVFLSIMSNVKTVNI